MARFNIPQSPKVYAYEIERFLGVDMTNTPNNVDARRSPNAPNMVRETVGKVKKRDGISTVRNYSSKGACKYTIDVGAKPDDTFRILNTTFIAYTTAGVKRFIVPPSGATPEETATSLGAALAEYFDYLNVEVIAEDIIVSEKAANGVTPRDAVADGDIKVTSTVLAESRIEPINGAHFYPARSIGVDIPLGRMPGDCDGDGLFTGADRDILLSYYMQSVSPGDPIDKKASDIDGDGIVAFFDLNYIDGRIFNPYGNSSITSRDLLGTWGTKYDLGITTTDWLYYVDIAVADIDPFMTAEIKIDPDEFGQFYIDYLGILPEVECMAGGIRVFAKLMPKGILHAKLTFTGQFGHLIHAGTKIWSQDNEVLYADAKDHRSTSVHYNGALWILDGKKFLKYDGTTIDAPDGYVPTVLIGRSPTGGGVLLEEINLIQPKMRVKFLGVAAVTAYYLPHNDITSIDLVQVMDGSGVMQDTTAYTEDLSLGKITFNTAPGASPIPGEDNVYVTYTKTIAGYADRIDKCDICTLYGMNGAMDRLFVSCNPDFPNYDWYSAQGDLSYFGDLSYSVIGKSDSEIMGYSIVNDYLVTHKSHEENNSNATLRAGKIVDGRVVFAIQGSYSAAGALSKYAIRELANEPLYVTDRKNISAITPSDVIGERLSQERSFYLSGALQGEDLSDAFAYAFNDFYYLATPENMYLLDSLQFSLEKNKPYSSRQYEGYVFPNVKARVLWSSDGVLYFGDALGNVKKFVPAADDDGEPISAWWDTPEFDGNSFAYKKTFRYIAVRLASFTHTGVRIMARVRGIWSEVKAYSAEANYFDFNDIDFEDFTFSTDDTPRTLGTKLKIKNVDKVQFRFENSKLNHPFGLYKIRLEYTESGKYAK